MFNTLTLGEMFLNFIKKSDDVSRKGIKTHKNNHAEHL